MRRNMDLIRGLLLKLEELDTDPGSNHVLSCYGAELTIEGFDGKEIGHHVEMLIDADLIVVDDNRMMNGHEIYFQRVSWQGHEFISAIREKEIWEQTKEAAKKGGVEALGAVWDIAKAIGKNELKRRTGIEI